jgi:large subunit ribosomal protein L4
MAAPKAPTIGAKTGTVTLDEGVFGESFHEALVHETARAELNARRSGNASTLTRGQVSMTGAKAWRQKGTGRARAGALSTPQRTGGGIAFGPSPRSYTFKVNRKARRKALRAALSLHAERSSLAVIDCSSFDAPSTKAAVDALAQLDGDTGESVLIVLADGEENAAKSFRNIAEVSVAHVHGVGVADIVAPARLVISQDALETITAIAKAPARQAEEAAA